METKLRWFQSDELSVALLKRFSAAISAHPFTQDAARGFIISRSRGSSITAKFIEKIVGNREITDPFGNVIQLPFVNYEVIQFRLSSDFPNLELLNAPKSPKKLFFFLTEITRESFAMSPLEIDLKKWVKAIASKFGKADITEIDYCDITVNPNVAADINFYGAGDVAASAREFLGKRGSKIVRSKVLVQLDNRDAYLELTRSGGLRTNISLDSKLVDEFRATVAIAVGDSD